MNKVIKIREGMRSRFFQKSKVVLDLNWFAIGRFDGETPAGLLHSDYSIRFKFLPFGKNKSVMMSHVPEGMIIPVKSPYHSEGMDIILPYITTSPGYQLFERYPLSKLADAERRVKELELEISSVILKSRGLNTPAQYKELLEDFFNVFEKWRLSVNRVPEMPVSSVPTSFERPKPTV